MPKPSDPIVLSVSIVTYRTPAVLLDTVWRTVLEARRELEAGGRACQLKLTLVDNSIPGDRSIRDFTQHHSAESIELHVGHGNIGYGAAHNLAICGAESDYHLILNPDVELASDALLKAVAFMQAHPQCGLLAPAVSGTSGEQQYLCKRYPALLDFVLRGFAPKWLATRFKAKLDAYEMRDVVGTSVLWDPPVVSGCFMFFRTSVLKRLEGFDPRFFLYLEDFDLSLRAAKISRVAFVPQVRIVHHGGHAARKGFNHVRMFAMSAIRFYSKNGWKLL